MKKYSTGTNRRGYTKKKKKVCILGTAGSLVRTPWEDEEYEIWACAPVLTHPPAIDKKFDLLFELHPDSYVMNERILPRLQNVKCPVMMQRQYMEIEKSIEFPFDEIIKDFQNCTGKGYFTSTIAYMFAYAIWMGYEEIDTYGIHMAANEEYGGQRQACEYWIGVANGKGIVVHVPPESEICQGPYLYGYEQESHIIPKLRIRKAKMYNGITELEKQLVKVQADLNQQRGAAKDVDFIIKEFESGGCQC
jgi:hypothetical protein